MANGLGLHVERSGTSAAVRLVTETVDAVHMINFISNVKEVDGLLRIHAAITPTGRGRRHNVEVLHRSGVVLLVACWEAFVEDLAAGGLVMMIERIQDYTAVPKDVRERIAGKLHGIRAWELAGEGWKQACRNYLQEVLARTTGTLNTPRTAQVDELFEKVLGLKSISSKWAWRGRTAKSSQTSLDSLVTLRGSIAHRVAAAQSVRKVDVEDARELVSRLAVKSHNAVNGYLGQVIGSAPWNLYWYSETR